MQMSKPFTSNLQARRRGTSLNELEIENLISWLDQEFEQESSKKRKLNEEHRESEASVSFSGAIDVPNEFREVIEDASVDERISQVPTDDFLQRPSYQKKCSPLTASPALQRRIPSVADVATGDSGDLAEMILNESFFGEVPRSPSSLERAAVSENVAPKQDNDVGANHREENARGGPKYVGMENPSLLEGKCLQEQQQVPVPAEGKDSMASFTYAASGVYSTEALSIDHSAFAHAMEKSKRSQQLIQKWDRTMGLKACHAKNMLKTSKSRDQLMENIARMSMFAGGNNLVPQLTCHNPVAKMA